MCLTTTTEETMMTKCPDCGKRDERKGHQACPYPGLGLGRKPRRRPRRDVADRETQHGRYIDCGPAAWDDR